MRLFPVSDDVDRIPKGHPNRFGGIDSAEIFQSAAVAPDIRFQSDGHDRQAAFYRQFDADGVELHGIEAGTSCGLGENQNGYVLFEAMKTLIQDRPEVFSGVPATDHNGMKAVDGVFQEGIFGQTFFNHKIDFAGFL